MPPTRRQRAREEFTTATHPVWAVLKCVLLTNLLVGFVACAYDIQIGMGIVSGTLLILIVSLCLRIIGICSYEIECVNEQPPTEQTPTIARVPIQKQEYVLVSNPDMSIYIGTRTFPSQPSSTAYPPPY